MPGADRAIVDGFTAVPNAATIEAMREARRGNLPRFDSVEELFDDLHADD